MGCLNEDSIPGLALRISAILKGDRGESEGGVEGTPTPIDVDSTAISIVSSA